MRRCHPSPHFPAANCSRQIPHHCSEPTHRAAWATLPHPAYCASLQAAALNWRFSSCGLRLQSDSQQPLLSLLKSQQQNCPQHPPPPPTRPSPQQRRGHWHSDHAPPSQSNCCSPHSRKCPDIQIWRQTPHGHSSLIPNPCKAVALLPQSTSTRSATTASPRNCLHIPTFQSSLRNAMTTRLASLPRSTMELVFIYDSWR